ncbi:MAG: hypothetical protein AAFX80_19205, partial [Cyanobacteria bacterium J06639_18]
NRGMTYSSHLRLIPITTWLWFLESSIPINWILNNSKQIYVNRKKISSQTAGINPYFMKVAGIN